MTKTRRALSAPLREFTEALARLTRIDAENQLKFSPGPGRPATGRLSQRQMYLLTESIFFSGFRAFESFLRDVFLLYSLGKSPSGRRTVRSYLSPKSFSHAEELLKSSMPFLDWASADNVIERAEVYLADGFPVKAALVPRLGRLRDMKHLRNHIAHRSSESASQYLKVLRRHYTVIPLVTPEPGEYLLETDKSDPASYMLLTYLECLQAVATELT